jgi:hypothetical protein
MGFGRGLFIFVSGIVVGGALFLLFREQLPLQYMVVLVVVIGFVLFGLGMKRSVHHSPEHHEVFNEIDEQRELWGGLGHDHLVHEDTVEFELEKKKKGRKKKK